MAAKHDALFSIFKGKFPQTPVLWLEKVFVSPKVVSLSVSTATSLKYLAPRIFLDEESNLAS